MVDRSADGISIEGTAAAVDELLESLPPVPARQVAPAA
jgi:hypothetical protein